MNLEYDDLVLTLQKENAKMENQMINLVKALLKYTNDDYWFTFKREHNGIKEYDAHSVEHMKKIAKEAIEEYRGSI